MEAMDEEGYNATVQCSFDLNVAIKKEGDDSAESGLLESVLKASLEGNAQLPYAPNVDPNQVKRFCHAYMLESFEAKKSNRSAMLQSSLTPKLKFSHLQAEASAPHSATAPLQALLGLPSFVVVNNGMFVHSIVSEQLACTRTLTLALANFLRSRQKNLEHVQVQKVNSSKNVKKVQV